MAIYIPARDEAVVAKAVTQLLVEEARLTCARARRLAEKAEELVVEARARRAQRAFTLAARFAPRPSGT